MECIYMYYPNEYTDQLLFGFVVIIGLRVHLSPLDDVYLMSEIVSLTCQQIAPFMQKPRRISVHQNRPVNIKD